MPPTFVAFLAWLLYSHLLVAFLVVGVALLLFPKPRLLGKKLLLSGVFTIPGLLLGAVLTIVVMLITLAITNVLPADSQWRIVFVIFGMAGGGVLCLAGILLGLTLGWQVGGGRPLRAAIRGDGRS